MTDEQQGIPYEPSPPTEAVGDAGAGASGSSDPPEGETPRFDVDTQSAPAHRRRDDGARPVAPGRVGVRERFPTVAGYTIQRCIGRGGMGVVYEATQLKLNRSVALKLLPAVSSTAHPDLIERFRREAEAAGKLHHTNIIPIYDFGESPDGYYYAMELLDGVALSELIPRLASARAPQLNHAELAVVLAGSDEVVPFDQSGSTIRAAGAGGSFGTPTSPRGRPYYRHVAQWIGHAAEALHYAHVQGLVHRDVKPSNLMLCREGRIVVLDFGLVKSATDHSVTATGSLIGTFRYMSPEQVGAQRVAVDARSDVYSLGATLYELLTFQPVFVANNQSELFSLVLFKDPEPPRNVVPTVPVDLQTICLKALEKDPGRRYDTGRALAEDLRRFLQDDPIVARPPGPVRRIAKLVKRKRITAAVLVGLIPMALVAGLVGGYFRAQARRHQVDDLQNQGHAHWNAKEWKEAGEDLAAALALDPNDYDVLCDLAIMYSEQTRHGEGSVQLLHDAQGLLERALEINEAGYEAWNVRAAIYQNLGQYQEALSAYERARALREDYYPAWVNLAMLHACMGDAPQALACARQGVALFKTDPSFTAAKRYVVPLQVLASLELCQGQLTEAEQTLELARARTENKDVAILVLGAKWHLAQHTDEDDRQAVRLATVADSLVKLPAARAGYQPTPQQDYERVKRVLAMASLRSGAWVDAIDAARAGLEQGGEPCWAHLVLAAAAAAQGEPARAEQHLQQAEAVWPPGLREAAWRCEQGGNSLWCDTAAEYEALRQFVSTATPAPDPGRP